MSNTAVKRASFAVEDMREGGGSLFGSGGPVRAKIDSGKFSKEAPDGYTAEGNPVFAWVTFLLAGDAPVEERRVSQTFSLGSQAGDNFTVSEDGDYLIPNNDDAAIVKDCKFGTFASSLQNEGVPKTVMADFAFSKIAGLDGDFKRIADKERSFAEEKRNAGKKKFPPSTLCCVKVHGLPGEKSAAPAASGKTASATAAAPAASTGDIDSDALTYLTQVLTEKGGTIQRGQITLKVSQLATANKDSNRAAVAKRAGEESFLNSLVEAGLVTFAPSEKGQPVSLVQ